MDAQYCGVCSVKEEKKVPLSLEELLAKKKAEEEAESKVRDSYNYYCQLDTI